MRFVKRRWIGGAALFLMTFQISVAAVAQTAIGPMRSTRTAPEADKTSADAAPPLVDAPAGDAYILGSGDKVRITVYNEDTLSGEYEVDGSGQLSLQLIGAIKAAGLSVPQLTAIIQDKLREGFLRNPSVAVEVLNYRPFYVLGEVKEPGKYPFVSGMTVLNAIALAGGYTYRGKKDRAMLIRADDPAKKEKVVTPSDAVMPGDIIRVPERVF